MAYGSSPAAVAQLKRTGSTASTSNYAGRTLLGKQECPWHWHAPRSCLQPCLHGQHGTVQLKARRQRHTVALASTKPSHNIFERVEQDLLPDGKPNTAWRRLLIRIRATQSLADLTRVWQTNLHKTLVWKPIHSAAVLQRAALLAYPTALLAPQELVVGHVSQAAQLANDHPLPPVTSQDSVQGNVGAVAQHERASQGKEWAKTKGLQHHQQQQHNSTTDAAEDASAAWSAAGLPAVITRTPEEFQVLLNTVASSVADAAVVRLLSSTCLIQLLYSAVQLHCVMPRTLQQAMLGELLRDACKKLQAADVGLIHDLVVALAVLHPPSPQVAAAVGAWTSQRVSAPIPTASIKASPPSSAPVPAFLTDALPNSNSNGNNSEGLPQAAGGQQQWVKEATKQHQPWQQLLQQQQQGILQQEGGKEFSFQEHLSQHAQHAVPTPLRPAGKRRQRPLLTSQGGVVIPAPSAPPAVPGGDTLTLWLEVTRAALQLLIPFNSKTTGLTEVPQLYMGDVCRLIAVLSQLGCLSPALASSFELLLQQMGVTAEQQHRSSRSSGGGGGSSKVVLNTHAGMSEAASSLYSMQVGAGGGYRLMDWSHQMTVQGSHLCDPWHAITAQDSKHTVHIATSVALQSTMTAATRTRQPAAAGSQPGQGHTAKQGNPSSQQDVQQDAGDDDSAQDYPVSELTLRLPHDPNALADLMVTFALRSQQGTFWEGDGFASCALQQLHGSRVGHSHSTQTSSCLHSALQHGGCMERFLWLLPEASLTDVTRVCWAMAFLASACCVQPSSVSHGDDWLGQDGDRSKLCNQHTLQDVMAVLCSYVRRAPYRWSMPHLVCMCEAIVELQPHLGHAGPSILCHLAMIVVEQMDELVAPSPLHLRLRLLQSLTAAQHHEQDQIGSESSSSSSPRHEQDQIGSGSAADNSSSSSGGSSSEAFDAVLGQAMPLLVCSIASSIPQLSLEDMATLLMAVSKARAVGISDCVAANRALRQRGIADMPPDAAHGDWWKDGVGLASNRNQPTVGFTSDAGLMKQVHVASLQAIKTGRIDSATGVAQLTAAWMALGCHNFARELVQRTSLLTTA